MYMSLFGGQRSLSTRNCKKQPVYMYQSKIGAKNRGVYGLSGLPCPSSLQYSQPKPVKYSLTVL